MTLPDKPHYPLRKERMNGDANLCIETKKRLLQKRMCDGSKEIFMKFILIGQGHTIRV